MRGKHVAIVGAGNSAGQAATHLAKHAATVTLLVRGDSLSKSMSDYLIGELRRTPNVFVRLGVDLVDGEGEEQLETIVVRDRASGELECIASDGLFVMIGAEPRTDWLGDAVERTSAGSSSPVPICRRTDGRSIARRSCSRRACPACSPPATSVTAR